MENLWPDAFPTLKNLTPGEILTIWDSVSECIRQHLAQDRGVRLLGIGTFYVLKDYTCTVNSEVSIVRRPMFHMSKVVADECNLSYAEEGVPADVTVVPLRCEELSVCAQLPFTTVQCCVYETVTSFFRATSKRQDTDFVFKAIGILSIRNREVTMRFFDDFLLAVDGTGKLLEALLSAPGRRHLVVSGRESPDFHMGPGGVFVLPQFVFTLPPEKEAVECPSVGLLKATEEREEEEEEKEEEESDKQIETDVPESPPTERLLSQGRRSRSPSTLSGPKKGKGQKSKGRRSPGSFLPRIQESFLVVEKDGEHRQTLGARPQTALPVFRNKKRTSPLRRETRPQARLSHETLTEIWPCSPLPLVGKEERTAPFLHRAVVKRKLESPQGLRKLNVFTNLSPGNLSSSSCPRREGLQLLSSGAGQLSVRAKYTLQLLETYHMRREEWRRRVELNRQRNYEENQLLWHRDTLPCGSLPVWSKVSSFARPILRLTACTWDLVVALDARVCVTSYKVWKCQGKKIPEYPG
ncbi:uncharacterized protein M6G45_009036 isoform 2-T2 [Spheniscus humboldti]